MRGGSASPAMLGPTGPRSTSAWSSPRTEGLGGASCQAQTQSALAGLCWLNGPGHRCSPRMATICTPRGCVVPTGSTSQNETKAVTTAAREPPAREPVGKPWRWPPVPGPLQPPRCPSSPFAEQTRVFPSLSTSPEDSASRCCLEPEVPWALSRCVFSAQADHASPLT